MACAWKSLLCLVLLLIASSAIMISPASTQAVSSGFCDPNTPGAILGTDGDDSLVGTDGDDVIVALGGHDKIDARGGDDIICAGDGDDTVDGGDGNDAIDAGAGDDKVIARAGNDLIIGGDGHDNLKGGEGNDRIEAGPGRDKVSAGNGDDRIFGGDGDDRLDGGRGNDTIDAGAGDDKVIASNGDDRIDAGPGRDKVIAGNGDDDILGGDGDDYLNGGRGDDVIDAGAGHDKVVAGDGVDSCVNAETNSGCEIFPDPDGDPHFPDRKPCLVGDDCPAHRMVSDQALCVITSAFGDIGNTLFVGGSCDDRNTAFLNPTRQVNFTSAGELRVNGLCLQRGDNGAIPTLASCTQSLAEAWEVDADGTIRGDGLCLAVADPAVRRVELVDCATHPDPRWGFIPIGDDDPYRVEQVYITASDSSRRDRAPLLQRALEIVRNDWIRSGATWEIAPAARELDLDLACAAVPDLAAVRSIVVRELSLLRQFSYNAKYNAVAECPTPGAANASRGIAVYSQSIFDGTEMQIDIDPQTAGDGDMAEIGVFGHELGHAFGLPHENCAIGGWQGGIDEEGDFNVRGLPTGPTQSVMCNGAFYPNVDVLADYQKALVFDRSCQWFSECDDDAIYGSDGRPYGCGLVAATPPVVRWDTTPAGQSLTAEVRRFTFGEGTVSEAITNWSQGGYAATDALAGEKNYFAIGRPDASPAEVVSCGVFTPQ